METPSPYSGVGGAYAALWGNSNWLQIRGSRVGFSTVGVFAHNVAPAKQVTASLHFAFFSFATESREATGGGTLSVRVQ